MLDAFGAELDEPLTLHEVADAMVVAVGIVPCDGGVLAFEINGFQGARTEVLRVVSAAGRAASIFWNVNGIVQLTCASAGDMRGSEELLVLDENCSLPPEVVPPLVAAFEREEDMVLPGVLAAEAFTGLSTAGLVVPSDVTMYPLLTAVPDLEAVDPRSMLWSFDAPELAARILAASSPAQRALAEWAAYQALQRVELADDPRVEAVLDGFGRGSAASFEPAMGLLLEVKNRVDVVSRSDDSRHGGEAGPPMVAAWMADWAVRALRYATLDDTATAALGATESLLPFVGHDAAALTTLVTEVLAEAEADLALIRATAILARVVSFLLSVTFACGLVIAVAHVVNRRFVAPVYDVVLNLLAFASAVSASVLLGHWTPALLSAFAIACWLLLARRTYVARRAHGGPPTAADG